MRATTNRPGILRLRTIGRHTGKERNAMLGYLIDGPNLAVVAMNGWADADPAWWLNLQANPEAIVDLRTGPHGVRARVANADERERLWPRLAGPTRSLDDYAALRSKKTPVVILEPWPNASLHRSKD